MIYMSGMETELTSDIFITSFPVRTRTLFSDMQALLPRKGPAFSM